MKKFTLFFLLAVLLAPLPLFAQSESEAREAALSFLQKRSKKSSVRLTSVSLGDKVCNARSSSAATPNAQMGGGIWL